MKISYLQIIFLCLFFFGCETSNKQIHKELEKLDNSLDSLIKFKTYSKKKFLVFQGDTLKSNPKTIIEDCYLIVGKDSTKIEANSNIYDFKDNRIITSVSKVYGKNYIQKYTYFDRTIDNELMFDKWDKINDTIYFALVEQYDSLGRLIKNVRAQNFSNSRNRERIIEVYEYYSNDQFKTWRKELYSDLYNLDTIRKLKVKEFVSNNYKWNWNQENFKYEYDKQGNWIVKKSIDRTNEVYYRTIKY